jgi:hypothetical protein
VFLKYEIHVTFKLFPNTAMKLEQSHTSKTQRVESLATRVNQEALPRGDDI